MKCEHITELEEEMGILHHFFGTNMSIDEYQV